MNGAAAAVVGAVLGYLLGGVPFGLLVGRAAGIRDVREYGSGKTGFTNSLRTLGWRWVFLVVLGDITKGAAAVLIARTLIDDPWAASTAGLMAVLGHIFPVYARFRGGRGVATAFGAFLAVSPLAAITVIAVSLVILAVWRYASLMSVVGVFIGFLVVAWLVRSHHLATPYFLFATGTMLAIELSHRGNIRRLLAGTEPRLGQGGSRRTTGAS